jgi:predicted phosphodiesterase
MSTIPDTLRDVMLTGQQRLGLISDTHGFHAREAVEYFVEATGVDALLVAGDLEDYRGYGLPTVFIRGNNESLPVLEELRLGTRRPAGLRYLPDGERLAIAGHEVAAVGGKWGPSGSTSGRHIDPAQVDALVAGPRPDIVVSHESPLIVPDHADTDPRLADACLAIGPKLWISGHRHRYLTGEIGGAAVVGLGNYPHGWATIEIEPGRLGEVRRFVPADPGYGERLDGWMAAKVREAELLKELQRRPGRSRLVYGVTDPDNEHALRWFAGMPDPAMESPTNRYASGSERSA